MLKPKDKSITRIDCCGGRFKVSPCRVVLPAAASRAGVAKRRFRPPCYASVRSAAKRSRPSIGARVVRTSPTPRRGRAKRKTRGVHSIETLPGRKSIACVPHRNAMHPGGRWWALPEPSDRQRRQQRQSRHCVPQSRLRWEPGAAQWSESTATAPGEQTGISVRNDAA
jgi:hypothetical protein